MSEHGLSLWNIEADLANLIDLREEMAGSGEDIAPIEAEIRAYCERSLRKVDGIRSYLKHAEMMVTAAKTEAEQQSARAKAWQSRIDRLKEFCRSTMETWGAKRLDGRTGSLILKGNGGKQAVTITDASLIPEELCDFEGKIHGGVMYHIREVLKPFPVTLETLMRYMERIPHKGRIASEMEKPCEACDGIGKASLNAWGGEPRTENLCPACGGTGKRGVPGARLEPRGNHLEVK